MPTVAMGTTFKKGAGGTAIANLTSIDGVSVSSDTIESTDLSTTPNYRTFLPSLKDAGEISISGYFTHSAHATILTDFESGTSASWIITFPDTKTWTFTGFFTSFSTSAELEDLVSFEAVMKISGKPVLA